MNDRRVWRYASCAAAVGAAVGWMVVPQINDSKHELVDVREEIRGEVFAAADNEFRNEKFVEGSSVTMLPGARLQFDFAGPKRRINLNRGQARFTVTKDPSRPFTVETTLFEVTALGTIFTVDVRNCGRVVDVHEGAVLVSGRGAAASLSRIVRAGEGLDLGKCP